MGGTRDVLHDPLCHASVGWLNRKEPNMSKSDAFESDLLKLVFQNVGAGLIGDTTGLVPSTGAGSLYISLHSSDPGEAGTQATNEISYTGYARVAVARTSGAWTVSATAPTQVTNAALITFGLDTVGSVTVAYFGVGCLGSAAGKLLYSGQLTANLAISPGITPSFVIGALVVTED
jgi:hypothetical protein